MFIWMSSGMFGKVVERSMGYLSIEPKNTQVNALHTPSQTDDGKLKLLQN